MKNHRGESWPAKYALIFAVVSIFALVTDQYTKIWALDHLQPGEIRPLVGTFLSLQLVFNPGAAFSFLSHATWLFTIIAVVVCLTVIFYAPRIRSIPWALGLGFLLGGSVGNLIDRLTRPPAFGVGHVIDFLNWNGMFVGNVADIWIVLAAIELFILAMFGVPATVAKPLRTASVKTPDEPKATSSE